jgi:riboflavin kinase/FMN adenylyltransferase
MPAAKHRRPANIANRKAPIDRVVGAVSAGRGLGRTLGFPTANLVLATDHVRHGVYVVVATLADGRQFGGVANLGLRPTVGAEAPLLEAHLFDFDGDLYGQWLEIELQAYLRPERRFSGIDALRRQIARDKAAARRWLRRLEHSAAVAGREERLGRSPGRASNEQLDIAGVGGPC